MRRPYVVRLLVLLVSFIAVGATGAPLVLAPSASNTSSQLVIRFATGTDVSSPAVEELIKASGGRLLGILPLLRAALVEAENPMRFQWRIGLNPRVIYVEPNLAYRLIDPVWQGSESIIPGDPYYSEQWNMKIIGMEDAWSIQQGDPGVVVAVIDTGVDYLHTDLAPNFIHLGHDWVSKDADPMDQNGHGTHVAGIIAAEINNDVGVAGVAPGISIMAERVLNAWGIGLSFWIASGIVHAASAGADVISMSLGGSESQIISDAVEYATNQGSLVVAAAGNEAGGVTHPASHPRVIAVTATNSLDQLASYSNYGTQAELAAPGGDDENGNGELDEPGTDEGILSCFPGDSYAWAAGTSMATPHISAVAALIKSKDPTLTWLGIRNILHRAADDLGAPGWDQFFGYGRVNGYQALLTSSLAPTVTVQTDKASYRIGETAIISVTLTNPGPAFHATGVATVRDASGRIQRRVSRDIYVEIGMTGEVEVVGRVPVIAPGTYTVEVELVTVEGEATVAYDSTQVQVRLFRGSESGRLPWRILRRR